MLTKPGPDETEVPVLFESVVVLTYDYNSQSNDSKECVPSSSSKMRERHGLPDSANDDSLECVTHDIGSCHQSPSAFGFFQRKNTMKEGFQDGPSLGNKIATFVLFHVTFGAIIGGILLMFSGFYYIKTIGLFFTLPYITYITLNPLQFKDGARWNSFSRNNPLFVAARKYFRFEVAPIPEELRTMDEKPDAQFIFAFTPHGVNSDFRVLIDGVIADHVPNAGSKVRTLAASVLFRLPVLREMCLWTGCVDARRAVAEKTLKKGQSIIVIPGGQAEMIRTSRGKELMYLKKRKGFIKLAMRESVPVVPVYVFGASDAYYTSHAFFGFRQLLLKYTGACIPLAVGLLGSPFCPLPSKHTLVFGKPMTFKMNVKGSPSDEELDVAHAEYVAALIKLFDENKGKLGYADRELMECG